VEEEKVSLHFCRRKARQRFRKYFRVEIRPFHSRRDSYEIIRLRETSWRWENGKFITGESCSEKLRNTTAIRIVASSRHPGCKEREISSSSTIFKWTTSNLVEIRYVSFPSSFHFPSYFEDPCILLPPDRRSTLRSSTILLLEARDSSQTYLRPKKDEQSRLQNWKWSARIQLDDPNEARPEPRYRLRWLTCNVLYRIYAIPKSPFSISFPARRARIFHLLDKFFTIQKHVLLSWSRVRVKDRVDIEIGSCVEAGRTKSNRLRWVIRRLRKSEARVEDWIEARWD
jgi:hypothetical protein